MAGRPCIRRGGRFAASFITGDEAMTLSVQSIEALLDLVENRMDSMHVYDNDDLCELAFLKKTRQELRLMHHARNNPHKSAQIVPLFPAQATGKKAS
jgi:hypothetical protein